MQKQTEKSVVHGPVERMSFVLYCRRSDLVILCCEHEQSVKILSKISNKKDSKSYDCKKRKCGVEYCDSLLFEITYYFL